MIRYILCFILLTSTSHAFNYSYSYQYGSPTYQVGWVDMAPVPSLTGTGFYGSVNTGSTLTSIFTFSVGGTDGIESAILTTTNTSGTAFTESARTCAANPFDLALLGSCTVTVQFAPTAAVAYSGFVNYSAPNIPKYSIALSGTGVDTNPPTTPVISVTPGNTTNTIALTSGGVGATSYDVKRGLISGTRTTLASAVTLPYIDSALTNGTPYYYSLLAINTNGNAESTEVSGTPGAVTYTDSFTDTDTTPLATHNSLWASPGATYLVSRFVISGNQVATTTASAQAGAYHTASTSDTSRIIIKALSNTAQTVTKFARVRADATRLGYGASLNVLSSGNFTVISFFKETGTGTITGATCTVNLPANVDYALALTATGTSTVTLTAYIDGVQICQKTDPTSTYTSGHPGFSVLGGGTLGNNLVDEWRDYL